MKTIWKYSIAEDLDTFNRDMPQDAIFRYLRGYCMWFEVDTDKPMIERHFRVVGTGEAMPYPEPGEDNPSMIYLGTTFVGPGVWHIYEDVRTN